MDEAASRVRIQAYTARRAAVLGRHHLQEWEELVQVLDAKEEAVQVCCCCHFACMLCCTACIGKSKRQQKVHLSMLQVAVIFACLYLLMVNMNPFYSALVFCLSWTNFRELVHQGVEIVCGLNIFAVFTGCLKHGCKHAGKSQVNSVFHCDRAGTLRRLSCCAHVRWS